MARSMPGSPSFTTSRACSDSGPLSRWCHPSISSTVTPFPSCPQSFQTSRPFPVSQLFASGGRSIGVSVFSSVLPVNIQGWFPLGRTGLILLFSYNLWDYGSVQFSQSVMSDCLRPHGLQYARSPCSSPTPRVYSNPCPLSQGCHPTISSSVVPFSSCLQSLKSLLHHHSSKAPILQHSGFFIVQLSHPYMTTGKTIALTRWTFVGKVMSLLFNMLSRLVITFLPSSMYLLISRLQSPSAVILEPHKNSLCFHCFPIYLPYSDGTRCHDLRFLNVEF